MFKWSFGVGASIAIIIFILIFASGYGIATSAEENSLLTSDCLLYTSDAADE